MSGPSRPSAAGELVHLPEPSVYPLGVAFGVALVAVGLFTGAVVSIIGAVVGLRSARQWLRQNQRDVGRLRQGSA